VIKLPAVGGGNAYIAADDFVVLSVLDNLLDFLDSTVHVGSASTNDNDVLGRSVTSVFTKLDRKRLLLADDPIARYQIIYSHINQGQTR
jgi:hypothetical protein